MASAFDVSVFPPRSLRVVNTSQKDHIESSGTTEWSEILEIPLAATDGEEPGAVRIQIGLIVDRVSTDT